MKKCAGAKAEDGQRILEDLGKHHVWCAHWTRCHADKCGMCKRLREKYPEDVPRDQMMKKYFPDMQVFDTSDSQQWRPR